MGGGLADEAEARGLIQGGAGRAHGRQGVQRPLRRVIAAGAGAALARVIDIHFYKTKRVVCVRVCVCVGECSASLRTSPFFSPISSAGSGGGDGEEDGRGRWR